MKFFNAIQLRDPIFQYSIFPSFQLGAKRIKFTPYLVISLEINMSRHLKNTIIEDEEEHEDEYDVRQHVSRFVLVVVLVLEIQRQIVSRWRTNPVSRGPSAGNRTRRSTG
jgi:hypothetical protein